MTSIVFKRKLIMFIKARFNKKFKNNKSTFLCTYMKKIREKINFLKKHYIKNEEKYFRNYLYQANT